jgi:ABC-type Fe3+/spermidine/putrescine transport system ATPase subunit
MMKYDLELIKVGKVYDNGTPAVIGFDLNVAKGEFIAFLGPSGCGKTTTLRMIAGFETVTSGDILIKGAQMTNVPPDKRPTSMIFQNYALFPHMDVRRNVGYGLEVKGMGKAERNAKVDRILATLGLDEVADKYPDRLSGGQRQRIALARGLIVEPDILLLDEPLGALDANLRKTIQNELKLLQKNLGITFVFVTHAQSEALALSDRVVVMNQGRVEQISPPHRLYTRPDTPFVAQFIGRNIVLDCTVNGVEAGRAMVDTPLGPMSGTGNGSFSSGAQGMIVVPAEAIDVKIAGAGSPAGGGNAVAGRIARAFVVGHVSNLSVELPGGRLVSLEAHIDKYPPGAFAPGAEILLTWAAAEATVIAAR